VFGVDATPPESSLDVQTIPTPPGPTPVVTTLGAKAAKRLAYRPFNDHLTKCARHQILLVIGTSILTTPARLAPRHYHSTLL